MIMLREKRAWKCLLSRIVGTIFPSERKVGKIADDASVSACLAAELHYISRRKAYVFS